MKGLNNTFASSTSWTERVGFAAAEATIGFFKDKKVNDHINEMGKYILEEWKKISLRTNVDIKVGNYFPIPSFKFNYKVDKKLSTIFTYEMLKKNYLATNYIFLSYSHKKKDLKKYLINFENIFFKINKFLKNKKGYNFLENKKIK